MDINVNDFNIKFILLFAVVVVILISVALIVPTKNEKLENAFSDACYELRSARNCTGSLNFPVEYKQYAGDAGKYTFIELCRLKIGGSLSYNADFGDCFNACGCSEKISNTAKEISDKCSNYVLFDPGCNGKYSGGTSKEKEISRQKATELKKSIIELCKILSIQNHDYQSCIDGSDNECFFECCTKCSAK